MIKRRGITLIELLIVMTIFAIASAALWSYAAGVLEQRRINRLSEQMLSLVQNVKGLSSTMQNTSQINNNTVINARLVAPEMIGTGNHLVNIYNGDIILTASTIPDVAVAQFSNIPSAVCMQLMISYLGKDLRTFQQAGLYGLKVGTSPTTTPYWSIADHNLPPTRDDVERGCFPNLKPTVVNVDIYFNLSG